MPGTNRISPAALVAAALCFACAPADPGPSPADPHADDAIDAVLAPRLEPSFQSEVIVLGTVHLSGHAERLEPRHLEKLLEHLSSVAPTRIAIEAQTPDEIALLESLESADPAAAQLLDMFGRTILTTGREVQRALGVDRATASLRARELLERPAGQALTDRDRLSLVAWLLAAYDYHSAVLQWSYLAPEVRLADRTLPAEVRERLDQRLESPNEIVTIATALARRLGLQRLHAIDSQYDGVRTLSIPRELLEALYSDSARVRLQDHAGRARGDSIREAAFAAGDLLPLFRYVNSDAWQRTDATQWNWLFEGNDPEGVDRFRYAMWDVRNLRQATNIVDATASRRPERLLVIVGASHKVHLDRVLATQLSVRLMQPDLGGR